MRSISSITVAALLSTSGLASGQVLNAHPGPSNNGGSSGWAMFFDLEALAGPVTVTELTTGASAGAGVAFTVEIFVRTGSGLGGPLAAGPGSSTVGWTSLGTAPATQGATANGITLPIDIPDIAVGAGQIVGVAMVFTGGGPRYFGTGAPPISTFEDGVLRLYTGDARTVPFTPTGSYFTSRAMVGTLTYTTGGGGPACYANCDNSTAAPILNVQDFSCFLNAFAAGDSYANCDGSTAAPVLNVQDFSCFLNAFAAGCS